MTSKSLRTIKVGAAQLGPIQRVHSRSDVVKRLVALMDEAGESGVDLVVYPELALTTFFPRWHITDQDEIDAWYETEMPSPVTQPLFDRAKELGIGFALGYAEICVEDDGTVHHYNTMILVEGNGSIVAKYRKIHIPGHDTAEPDRPFQHMERYYFEPGPDGFGVWRAFGGIMGMMLCNDRRWSETYRVMGQQGVEMILCGYNTPLHYSPDPGQNVLQGFHNHLVMQSGAYQNGTWVIGVAKGGVEEGVESLCQTAIIAPSGEIVARALTQTDELVVAKCDLDWCQNYKGTLFDFDRYRMPEYYTTITSQRGSIPPPPRDRESHDRHH